MCPFGLRMGSAGREEARLIAIAKAGQGLVSSCTSASRPVDRCSQALRPRAKDSGAGVTAIKALRSADPSHSWVSAASVSSTVGQSSSPALKRPPSDLMKTGAQSTALGSRTPRTSRIAGTIARSDGLCPRFLLRPAGLLPSLPRPSLLGRRRSNSGLLWQRQSIGLLRPEAWTLAYVGSCLGRPSIARVANGERRALRGRSKMPRPVTFQALDASYPIVLRASSPTYPRFSFV
jgi:hypothetical protein